MATGDVDEVVSTSEAREQRDMCALCTSINAIHEIKA